ncbi:MAG: sodium:solute symporter family protein [Methanomicrobiaceae archaeon]|nr:sodium:solute symporter family protein [Methanomicrobiaceae archaeon]
MAVDTLTFAVITLVYLIAVITLGYIGYRQTKGSDDFLVAGRRINPVVLALSYGATFISTSAIVGFGGISAQLGMGLVWLTVLCIGVGVLIAFVVFGKKTRSLGQKTGAVTYPDLLGKCYGSPFIRKISALIIIVSMPIYTAAILIGGARFIETTLSIPYDTALLAFAAVVAIYVVAGGLIAVMYTDALQGAIMFIGMTILLILTYVYLGGVMEANSALDAMAPMVPDTLAAIGMTGWASMPEFLSPIWLTMITTMVLGVGIGVLAQPQLAVRFMTVKDNRSIHRAVMVGGPFVLMMTGVAFTVGPLTNVWFMRNGGQLAVDAAGGNVDSIIPLFINSAMPDMFIVIFMLALLAAAMSTLSSLFHTMGTTIGYDLNPLSNGEKISMRPIQIGTLVMIVVSTIVAYALPANIIARATVIFMGLCAAAFIPAFAHALYSEKPSVFAAKLSIVAGAGSWFLWTAFVHVKESSVLGLSNALFGVQSVLPMPWGVVNPIVIALPVSAAALLAALFIEKNKTNKGSLNSPEKTAAEINKNGS